VLCQPTAGGRMYSIIDSAVEDILHSLRVTCFCSCKLIALQPINSPFGFGQYRLSTLHFAKSNNEIGKIVHFGHLQLPFLVWLSVVKKKKARGPLEAEKPIDSNYVDFGYNAKTAYVRLLCLKYLTCRWFRSILMCMVWFYDIFTVMPQDACRDRATAA